MSKELPDNASALNAPVSTPASSPARVSAAHSDDSCPKPPCPEPAKSWQISLMGAYFLLLFLTLLYLLLKLWITRDYPGHADEIWLFWGLFRRTLPDETRLLAIVMVAGAIGGFFHAARSLTDYAGDRRLFISWFWWYALRPFSGMALATVFYFLIRGGLLTGQVSDKQISVYGIAAFAGLAGMFSDQAALKLRDVFTTLFKTDDQRKDKLTDTNAGAKKPAITSINPNEVKAGAGIDISVMGTSFVQQSAVFLGDKPVETAFVSPTEMKVKLKATEIPAAGSFDLIVTNPAPSGKSDPVKLKVTV